MTTKANRTRSLKAAQRRIDDAKRRYGLAPGTGAAILKLASDFAGSPWALAVTLAALVACVVVLLI